MSNSPVVPTVNTTFCDSFFREISAFGFAVTAGLFVGVGTGVGVVIPPPVAVADGVADTALSQKPDSLYVPSPAAKAVFICPIGSNTMQMQIAVKIYHAVHFLFFI